MFGVVSLVANVMGRVFHRSGVTLGGHTFEEIHYPSMTRARLEWGVDEFSYEWTETTGRCIRIDVEYRACLGQTAGGLRPVIQVTMAPRIKPS